MRVPGPQEDSSRISGVRGDPFRKFPRHAVDEAPTPVKTSGDPLEKIVRQAQMWLPPRRQPHLGLLNYFLEVVPRSLHRGWRLVDSVPGEFSEGVPPDPGNP